MKTAQGSMQSITNDNRVLGGTATIAGTRIPIERIENLVREFGYTERKLRSEYPQVDIKVFRNLIGDSLRLARLSQNGQKKK